MKIVFLRQPYKFIRKAGKRLKGRLKEEVLKIGKDPKIGKKLKEKRFKDLFSHCFLFRKVHYRIAYKIEENLVIVFIASRENFYKDLQI